MVLVLVVLALAQRAATAVTAQAAKAAGARAAVMVTSAVAMTTQRRTRMAMVMFEAEKSGRKVAVTAEAPNWIDSMAMRPVPATSAVKVGLLCIWSVGGHIRFRWRKG